MNIKHPLLCLLILFSLLLQSPPASAVSFIFNSFNSTSVSLYGNATIQSNILTLTNSTPAQIGRALYPHKIPMKKGSSLLPFSTSFIFAMVPTQNVLPGHGFVFLFTPVTGIQNTNSAQNLGLLSREVDGNSSNHVFGVEFDVFWNEEFGDINGNHVGIDVNSLSSVNSREPGYPEGGGGYRTMQLNDGRNYQVWIEYSNFRISVNIAPAGMERPSSCFICAPLNLSDAFEDEMYVGFTAGTGRLTQSHKILSWSFNNTDDDLWNDGLITEGLPSFVLPGGERHNPSKGLIVGLPLGIFFVLLTCGVVGFTWIKNRRRLAKENSEMEEEYLDQMPGMPTRFSYEELNTATENFSKKLGEGGFGSVFEGSLKDGSKIAVKCLEGLSHIKKSFLAEVQSIGSIHHVNLVRLRGFCTWKTKRFLVYDFMSNGSLDKWIYHGNQEHILDWKCRKKIILDIAKGLAYLHEECRQKIIHLDIKPQNILLDKDFNAKVSDFGLSKLIDRDESHVMTTMRGTPGYLAPEWLSSIITEKVVDVYSFGIVLLEILSGRKNFDRSQPEESWHLLRVFQKCWEQETLLDMIDMNSEDMQMNSTEVVEMLNMASWCLQTDYTQRPSMSMVVKVLEGTTKVEPNLDYNFTDARLQKNNSQEKDLTPLLPSVLSGPR